LAQRRINRLDDAIDLLQHIAIPKSNNMQTLIFKVLGSLPVLCSTLLGMLSSVHLYDEISLEAEEIEHIRTIWNLTAELPAIDLPVPHPTPQLALRVRLVVPQFSSEFGISHFPTRNQTIQAKSFIPSL
jgi:hypothetical protein